MAKKKAERKPKNLKEATGFHHLLNNEKLNFVLGIVLILLAIYAIFAMVSYLNTGQADQSLLEDLRPGEWLNKNKMFANYCGSIGALLAHQLIAVNFGLPAFLIPAFLILAGLRMMQVYRVNLWKWFFCMVIVMIWSSVALAKFLTPAMDELFYNTGGNHGLFCAQQIENLVGPPGLTAILLIVALAFLTYLSAETIHVVRKMLNPIGYVTSKVKFIITNHQENSENEPVPTTDTTEMPDPLTDDVVEELPTGNDDAEVKPIVPLVPPVEEEKTPEIDVEVGKDEDKAKGKTLTIEEIKSTPIDPREPFTRYKFPTLDLLKKYDNSGKPEIDMEEIKANNQRIVEVLESFSVDIKEIKATVGPTITLYEITPAPGVRISRIQTLEKDIALHLAALGIRIIAPMPGKGTIGIEVPNKKPNIVSMESILNSKKFQETTMDLPIALGKTITNEVYMADLAKIPHLLVAGATGQGKSVGLNAIITSLLYKKHPNELKFVLVDPKMVEFSLYQPISSHFMAALPENEEKPIITDVSKVVRTLNSLCELMERRYELLEHAHVKGIKEYNKKFVNHELDLTKGHEYMPYIVVVIDEFGDLIMTAGKEIELPIARIAQKARAVGIHMIIATQRPTTNIITGTIKANFPGRMAFRVMSQIDSRTILDQKGADQLVGRGDMLILIGNEPVRVQCAFVDTPEVERINKYVEAQPGPVEPIELPEPAVETGGGEGGGMSGGGGGFTDPLFEEVARAVVMTQQGSTSMIQRRFSIGFNRAGRLMDQLHEAGIVGVAQGAKPREVLISDENSLNNLIAKLKGVNDFAE